MKKLYFKGKKDNKNNEISKFIQDVRYSIMYKTIYDIHILRAIQLLVTVEIKKYYNTSLNKSVFVSILNNYLFKFFDNVYVCFEKEKHSGEIHVVVKFEDTYIWENPKEYILFTFPENDISKWEPYPI